MVIFLDHSLASSYKILLDMEPCPLRTLPGSISTSQHHPDGAIQPCTNSDDVLDGVYSDSMQSSPEPVNKTPSTSIPDVTVQRSTDLRSLDADMVSPPSSAT